jgi:hypothetical protein
MLPEFDEKNNCNNWNKKFLQEAARFLFDDQLN